MKQRGLCLLIVVGMSLVFCSSTVWGAPLSVQKAVKPATRPTQPIPVPVPEHYFISIEGIEKDQQCNFYYILRNTGSNLTVDQHKRSYTKFGEESQVSLAAADPAGKLRIKGNMVKIKTDLHLTGDPSKLRVVIIKVALFNGKEITRRVVFNDKCPTELPQIVPQEVMPQLPIKKKLSNPLNSYSNRNGRSIGAPARIEQDLAELYGISISSVY